MSQGTAFIIWLLCVGVSVILIAYFLKKPTMNSREGFAVRICPTGANQYITRDGETLCCNGDVIDGWCSGNNICSLSPKNRRGLISCIDLALQNATAAGSAKCPRQIPNYFSGVKNSLPGCSVSQSTPDGTAPLDPTQIQCALYPTQALDQVKLDSCYNYLQTSNALATANSPACLSAQAAQAAKQNAANAAAQAAQAAAKAATAEATAAAGGSSCPSA